MIRTRDWLGTVAALGGVSFLAAPAAAQHEKPIGNETPALDSVLRGATVALEVDGLSCPFCAYGMEKRLKELPAVDTVVVRVSDGLVLLRAKDGLQLTDAELRAAVERAGFSLRAIRRMDEGQRSR